MKKVDWNVVKTHEGYQADEVISALQKDIRRGNIDRAVFWAFELCLSGKEFQDKLWERLVTIAVEDIGLANPMASVVIQQLRKAFYLKFEREGDRFLQALCATAYLAQSKKDRYLDEIKNFFILEKPKYDIPDYALDKHTEKGKALGRGDEHFWKVASRLVPEEKTRNKYYLKRILAILSGKNKKLLK
jgi:replication-associated recombination protein RarA